MEYLEPTDSYMVTAAPQVEELLTLWIDALLRLLRIRAAIFLVLVVQRSDLSLLHCVSCTLRIWLDIIVPGMMAWQRALSLITAIEGPALRSGWVL